MTVGIVVSQCERHPFQAVSPVAVDPGNTTWLYAYDRLHDTFDAIAPLYSGTPANAGEDNGQAGVVAGVPSNVWPPSSVN